jgi:hypothetical protein
MPRFDVDLTGYFSTTISVEMEPDEDGVLDEYEIEVKAMQEFEDTYYPCGQWAESWDSVQIDGVNEMGA